MQTCAVLGESLQVRLSEELGGEVEFRSPPERLEGGFYTDNYAFELAGQTGEWAGPLIARFFPTHSPADQAAREAMVQEIAVTAGLPAPTIVFHDGSTIEGRQWFVMRRLGGRPVMGGIGVGEVLRTLPTVVGKLPAMTAGVHHRIHRIEPAALEPLVGLVGERRAGVGRWLDMLEELVDTGASGLGTTWRWLCDNEPAVRLAPTLCHGDLWGGNLLVEAGEVVGVIDWTVATMAEPALDVGFTTMSLRIAPVPMPRALRGAVVFASERMARRYVAAYRAGSPADLSRVPYYEALRCATELTGVVRYRAAVAAGGELPIRPTWDLTADEMLLFLEARTGVRPTLPS